MDDPEYQQVQRAWLGRVVQDDPGAGSSTGRQGPTSDSSRSALVGPEIPGLNDLDAEGEDDDSAISASDEASG